MFTIQDCPRLPLINKSPEAQSSLSSSFAKVEDGEDCNHSNIRFVINAGSMGARP